MIQQIWLRYVARRCCCCVCCISMDEIMYARIMYQISARLPLTSTGIAANHAHPRRSLIDRASMTPTPPAKSKQPSTLTRSPIPSPTAPGQWQGDGHIAECRYVDRRQPCVWQVGRAAWPYRDLTSPRSHAPRRNGME